MRIITGKNRGRNIVAPKNVSRPTLDRTKETLFDILQFDITGRRVLDLFAGSGALGLEADSRGALSVTFVDNDGYSIEAVKANCAVCRCNGEIIKADFVRALKNMSGQFDLVFVDPPYDSGFYLTAIQLLNERGLLSDQAIVACEHSSHAQLPDQMFPLTKYKYRKMGNVAFSFYKKEDNQ